MGKPYLEGFHWVKGKLGTGAFCSCYLARDIENGTMFAVKQVNIKQTLKEGGVSGNGLDKKRAKINQEDTHYLVIWKKVTTKLCVTSILKNIFLGEHFIS